MWRSFFLGVGIYLVLLGGQSLLVDRATLRIHEDAAVEGSDTVGPAKTLTPPPWAPWTLLSTGAVTCIYSFTLPKRPGG